MLFFTKGEMPKAAVPSNPDLRKLRRLLAIIQL
jgi:hypothetical protein